MDERSKLFCQPRGFDVFDSIATLSSKVWPIIRFKNELPFILICDADSNPFLSISANSNKGCIVVRRHCSPFFPIAIRILWRTSSAGGKRRKVSFRRIFANIFLIRNDFKLFFDMRDHISWRCWMNVWTTKISVILEYEASERSLHSSMFGLAPLQSLKRRESTSRHMVQSDGSLRQQSVCQEEIRTSNLPRSGCWRRDN